MITKALYEKDIDLNLINKLLKKEVIKDDKLKQEKEIKEKIQKFKQIDVTFETQKNLVKQI